MRAVLQYLWVRLASSVRNANIHSGEFATSVGLFLWIEDKIGARILDNICRTLMNIFPTFVAAWSPDAHTHDEAVGIQDWLLTTALH